MSVSATPVSVALHIEGPAEANSLDAAWSLLPTSGEGWVCLADEVRRFDASVREGWLLHAEVAEGPVTTSLRLEGGRWRCWRYEERAGDSHRKVSEVFVSSAPRQGRLPEMAYATYWEAREDDGLAVWMPVAARFVGWMSGEEA